MRSERRSGILQAIGRPTGTVGTDRLFERIAPAWCWPCELIGNRLIEQPHRRGRRRRLRRVIGLHLLRAKVKRDPLGLHLLRAHVKVFAHTCTSLIKLWLWCWGLHLWRGHWNQVFVASPLVGVRRTLGVTS